MEDKDRDYHLDKDPKELSNLQIMFALRDHYDEAIEKGFWKELQSRLMDYIENG